MMVSYRMNGASGTMMLERGVHDMQLAFNKVVQKLQADGALVAADIGKFVRFEGRVKIDRKRYPAISQGGLIVVKDGPKIPDTIKLEC